jgi:pimeloyl-ACP methyl ester carboxylesterase
MPFTTCNGIRVRYDIVGEGEPIVWISGTGNSGHIWEEHQIPRFSPHYRCITFDLRGTGESDSPEEPYSLELFAQDVSELVDHLGIESAHFVGMSLGSVIVQQLALTRPDLVRSAVLLATWSSTRREHHIRRWFEARLGALREGPLSVFRRFAFVMWAPSMVDFHPEVIERLEANFAASAASQPVHAYVNHFEADLAIDTQDRLSEISCPTVVIYGEEDLITLPWYNRTVAELIPNATAVEIPGAGHYAFLERPKEINDAIASFLARSKARSTDGTAN